MTTTKIHETKDKEFIKNWIEENGGVPARLGYVSTTSDEKDPLAVWFRGEEQDEEKIYQEIDWDEFFAIFDYHDFTFKYNDEQGDDRYAVFTSK